MMTTTQSHYLSLSSLLSSSPWLASSSSSVRQRPTIPQSSLYVTIRHGTKSHTKHPTRPTKYKPFEVEVSTTLVISGITLLTTLVGLLIVVPLNGWRMDRKVGWGLIALWCISTIGNV